MLCLVGLFGLFIPAAFAVLSLDWKHGFYKNTSIRISMCPDVKKRYHARTKSAPYNDV